MKRLFIIIAAVLIAVSAMARPVPTIAIKGDLNQYKYVHVISTSGTTSSSGVSTSAHYGHYSYTSGNGTKTTNPSEQLSGFFMKEGFTVLPSISPEIADKTLIVSYGFLGTDEIYSEIILQLTDANTHEVVASYETSGKGIDDAERVSDALNYVIELLRYTLRPHMGYQVEKTSCRALRVRLSNRTPFVISEVKVRLNYYQDEKLMHKQDVTIATSLTPAYSTITRIKRNKDFRGYKYKVEFEVLEYK
jgi:hypothetical protein